MATATKALSRQRERDALLLHYRELREAGAPAYQRREAYSAWFRLCCAHGVPPDALLTNSPDEHERFWARTIPGVDGHVLWIGAESFVANEGKQRRPARWVWAQSHGGHFPPNTTEIHATCGVENCVNIEHLAIRPRAERRIRFSDENAINTLKVLSLQLGHTASRREWDEREPKLPVTGSALQARYGSWAAFVKKAGLEPLRPSWSTHESECIAALRALRDHLGHVPNSTEYRENWKWLKDNGHPSSQNTIRKKLGSWEDAIRKAFPDG